MCRAAHACRLPSLQCKLGSDREEQQQHDSEAGAGPSPDERTPGGAARPCGQLSLGEYLAAARRLCLRRQGDWAVQLAQKGSRGGAAQRQDEKEGTAVATVDAGGGRDMLYAVGSHAHNRDGESARGKSIMYGWMPGKKKEEILGMQQLVLGLMQQHAVSCVADIGTGLCAQACLCAHVSLACAGVNVRARTSVRARVCTFPYTCARTHVHI